jgi:hypothetical protein
MRASGGYEEAKCLCGAYTLLFTDTFSSNSMVFKTAVERETLNKKIV